MKSLYICVLHILLLTIHPSVQNMDEIWAIFDQLPPALISNTYLFVGDELNVTCTLDKESIQNNLSVHDISFTFINPKKKAMSYEVCVDKRKVHAINSSSVVLSIRNVTTRETGVFYCYAGECMLSGSKSLGHTDDITVQYKPHNVTNFKCEMYNWDDHMKCTWTNPVPYVVENGYRDTFVVIKEGALNNATLCPQNDSVSCVWQKNNFTRKDNYSLTIEVWNAVTGIHTSQMFNVSANQIVKPAPVRNVKVKTSPNQCFKLSWMHESNQSKMYRITRQKYGDPKSEVVTVNTTDTTYEICDYSPFSVYTFTVDCYPLGSEGYWSGPLVVNVITGSQKIAKPGVVIVKESSNTTACMKKLQNLSVNWREVDKLYRNGIVDSYSVRLNGRVVARMSPTKKSHCPEAPNRCISGVVKAVIRE